jgi:hypothetical protein
MLISWTTTSYPTILMTRLLHLDSHLQCPTLPALCAGLRKEQKKGVKRCEKGLLGLFTVALFCTLFCVLFFPSRHSLCFLPGIFFAFSIRGAKRVENRHEWGPTCNSGGNEKIKKQGTKKGMKKGSPCHLRHFVTSANFEKVSHPV